MRERGGSVVVVRDRHPEGDHAVVEFETATDVMSGATSSSVLR